MTNENGHRRKATPNVAAPALRRPCTGAAQVAIACIEFYQRRISPHKGFCCAHRKVHGGYSCSEFMKGQVSHVGFVRAFMSMPNRFRECSAAYRLLAEKNKRPGYIARFGKLDPAKKWRNRLSATGRPSGEPGFVGDCCLDAVGSFALEGAAQCCCESACSSVSLPCLILPL